MLEDLTDRCPGSQDTALDIGDTSDRTYDASHYFKKHISINAARPWMTEQHFLKRRNELIMNSRSVNRPNPQRSGRAKESVIDTGTEL